MSFAAHLFLSFATLALSMAAVGCVETSYQPDAFDGPIGGAPFQDVSNVLERNCGTLDCHGSPFRPLRIYGKNGLRRPESNPPEQYYSGGTATTQREYDDNYASVVSLEPEILERVLHDKNPDPRRDLTLLRKPLLDEKHKGGPIFTAESAGYKCLDQWLRAGPGNAPKPFNTENCK